MNDIKKNLLLIESIILDESFKDAKEKFKLLTMDEKIVDDYIDMYKELSSRNIITGREKDIGYWIKQGWTEFMFFVDSKKNSLSKRGEVKLQKKDSIFVHRDSTKIVLIPLTKQSSIYYGKNTKWCTAATESDNYFNKYFFVNKKILFYCLFKDGEKYAAAYSPSQLGVIECFNSKDDSIDISTFTDKTGIGERDIHKWYSENKAKIERYGDINRISEESKIELVKDIPTLIYSISNPSDELLLQTASVFPEVIKGIKEPNKDMQMVAVKADYRILKHIDKPCEEAQLYSVSRDGSLIQYIQNPSEQVQITALKENPEAFPYIENPSEELIWKTIERSPGMIRYVNNPSIDLQTLAIKKHGGVIRHLRNPTKNMQKMAVENYPTSIRYIDNPDWKLQYLAVSNDPHALQYIDNPDEKIQLVAVNKIGETIRYITNPSEEVQIAAVTQDEEAIHYLDSVSKKVRDVWAKTHNYT